MKRREAIKSITLSTGLVISTGTWAGFLQSCSANSELGWSPQYLNEDEAKTVSALADLIIPGSDVPGALVVQVPRFIDMFLSGVSSEQEANKFKQGLVFFEEENRKKFFKLNKEQQSKILKQYFAITPAETTRVHALVRQKETGSSTKEYFIYSFLTLTRELTIHAWRTSEKIGEEVLSYDPVPGVYQGCISKDEVGRAWSL
jgi:hypothetical protein